MPEMFALDATSSRHDATPAVADLAFRIRGGDYHGRYVRIHARQCTIGSAPDCTLRLLTAGVRPLHCIITQGEAGAMVRRWSPDTRLNGRAFSDVLLTVGDRLEIGPIELEVMDDSSLPPRRPPAEALPLAQERPLADLAGEIAQQLKNHLGQLPPAPAKGIKKRSAAAKARVKKLKGQLKTAKAAARNLQQELAALQATQQQAEKERQAMMHSLAEADSLRDQWEEARATWEAECGALREAAKRAGERERQLESELSSLRTAVEEKASQAIAAAEQLQQQAILQERLSETQAEFEAAQESCSQLRSELAAAADREQRLCVEEQNLRHTISELEQRLAQAQGLVEAHGDPAQLQTQLRSLLEEKLKFEDHCAQLHDQLTQAQQRFACLTDERNQLAESLSTAVAESAERQSQCDAANEELKALRETLSSLTAELAECRQQRDAANTQLAALQEQLANANRGAEDVPSSDASEVLALKQALEEKETVLASLEDKMRVLGDAGAQSVSEYQQREAELNRRVEALERLASHLEEDLRSANEQNGQIELAVEQKHALEQQLSAAQRQWNEQRQMLEEQALSAHQQLQEVETQITSLQDALHATKAQVRERDDLLTQLREEVREQMGAWQQEREGLLKQLQALVCSSSGANVEPAEHEHFSPPADRSDNYPVASDRQRFAYESEPDCEQEHGVDRYADRSLLARELASADPDEPSGTNDDEIEACAPEAPVSVDSVLSRLGAAGIWRSAAVSEHSVHDASAEEEACPDPIEAAQGDYHQQYGQPDESENELAAAAEPSTSGPGEEESIEAYMARLLKRVRGDAVASAYLESQPAEAPAVAEDPAAEISLDSPISKEVKLSELPPGEFLPRASAPEQASDLAAMRELAVHSARQAIVRSSQQRFRRASLATTFGACALAALSVGLFAWGFDTGNYYAWGGCVVTAASVAYLIGRRASLKKRIQPLPNSAVPTIGS